MNKFIAASILTGVTLLSVVAPVAASSDHNPAGNNGVIKINRDALPDGIPQNQPHVDCSFAIEFYNYDKSNSYADVNFALQAPTNRSGDTLKVTSGNLKPFIGQDAAGGGTDLDARETYKLSFTGQPQKNQGYHVKATVTAPGSQGNDTKQKVFWVQPCADTPQVLGTSTNTPSQLPAELPNTGMSLANALSLGGIVAIAAYGFHAARSKFSRV